MDTTDELVRVEETLKSFGITDSTLEERKIVQELCYLVTKRAGYLSAAVTVACYRKMVPFMKGRTTVGVDGSVFEKSVPFKKYYLEALALLQPNEKVTCQLSKDGSGLGAVILAAAVGCKQ